MPAAGLARLKSVTVVTRRRCRRGLGRRAGIPLPGQAMFAVAANNRRGEKRGAPAQGIRRWRAAGA